MAVRLNFSRRPRVGPGGFFLQRLQVFAQQIEAGRDAEIDHDHVGGLGEIVADGHRLGGYIVLRQMGAVVGNVDGERLGGGLLFPRE